MGFMLRDSTTILIIFALTFLSVAAIVAAINNGTSPPEAGISAETHAKPGIFSVGSPARLSADELGFDEIIFVKRKPYSSNHYYTDINNGTSKDRFLADNGIYIYNLRTGQERAVVRAAWASIISTCV